MRFEPSKALAVCAALLWLAAPARAALATYVTPEQLAERATYVVEGTVVRRGSGYDPVSGRLATYTTLELEAVHRGASELDEVVIREPGGRLGDLVNEVDAVPDYAVGERVIAFLEPDSDGALRTSGWFFGKFRIEESATTVTALRDLDGHGRILGRAQAPAALEEWSRADLVAVAASTPRRLKSPPGLPVPAEFSRVKWQEVASADDPIPKFVALSGASPARWDEVDTGTTIRFNVERARNPLADGPAAVAEIARAIEAWNAIPESRVTLGFASDNYFFTAAYPTSPAVAYPAVNVILFGDPYEDIPDPVSCSGVLAVGGYWRTASLRSTVNGRSFYGVLRGYVIFADGFDCFLADPDHVAEIATHELGHTLGFGHSTAWDSVMRSSPYGGTRGARMGDDDRDAAHCHYPHTIALTAPNGGESWEAGTSRRVSWTTTSESGLDPGTVRVERTLDGTTWAVVTTVSNNGHYDWIVPSSPTTSARVRVVRPNRLSSPPGYPWACSQDMSNWSFTITAHVAGAVPESESAGLRLEKGAGGSVSLSWPASCSAAADQYAIYEGSLDALRLGTWDPTPRSCAAGIDRTESFVPAAGARYFLVTPLDGGYEGSLGAGSAGARPAPAVRCGTPQTAAGCE